MAASLFLPRPDLPKRGSDNQRTVHGKTEPEFNLAVTARAIFDFSITEEISDLLSHGLPFGDADAFAALAERTVGLLGLQIMSPLNARSLESIISRDPGVYNVAISVAAEGSGYTSKLREELRELQTRKDWSTTAAAHLLPDGLAKKDETVDASGPLAAPLPCCQSQEETLECLRSKPLTIMTGPPGTGKTQLGVNAVANAWLDGDKVLVTSNNNGAVNIAVERANKDVSSGLLVRTGNRDERVAVPGRITAASDQSSEARGNPAAARAGLKRAATERAQLMEKLAQLDELDTELLRIVEEREDLLRSSKQAARTLWTDADPPELPISSREIERRARRLLRTWWFRRFRARRLRRRLGCLETPSLEQLANWAGIDQRKATLASLRAYLRDEVTRNDGAGTPVAEFRTDSTSERFLLDAMQLGDLLPYAKLDVEGYELDFALLEEGIKLNVEVDGDQHLDARGRQRRQDLARDRVLAKLSWTVLRIPAWRCHEEIDSVIDEIKETRSRLLDEAS